ncbi:MAG: Nif3-like dinuclear metal center hexameric protein [Clostridia bacterium]|nr:Nif3-like dinuclear metal center hexameric protein [Clostridia bacterium]
MKISDLLVVLDLIAPFELQDTGDGGDNCGLIIGREDADVRRVMISVDLTKKAVETAKKEFIDVIITHHPPIFRPIKRLCNRLFLDLVESGIAVVSLHTNYDCARLNDILAEKVGLTRTEGILECESLAKGKSYLGRIGILDEPMTGEDIIQRVKEELGIEYVRIIGDVRDNVVSAAVSQGSTSGFEKEIIDLAVDVYITGEVKYNSAVDLGNAGCFIIEAGHYETEKLFISDLTEVLGYRLPELEVMPFYDRVVTTI